MPRSFLTARSRVLESFVTKRRNRKAALKFLKKAMRRHGSPEVMVTDRLRSYGAALRTIGASDLQETGRNLNNRAENSHQPLRTTGAGDAALSAALSEETIVIR